MVYFVIYKEDHRLSAMLLWQQFTNKNQQGKFMQYEVI